MTQKPGDHGTLNTHNCWFILFYHVRGYDRGEPAVCYK